MDITIARKGHREELRTGICFALTKEFLTRLLDAFEGTYPKVTINLAHRGIDEHAYAIRRGAMDVAFLAEVDDIAALEVLPLWQERLHVAMSERDPRASRMDRSS